MSKIAIDKVAVSGGLGVLDEVLDRFAPAPIVGDLTPTDIARLSISAGSALINLMGVESKYSEVAFYSELPLAIKTGAKIIGTAIPSGYSGVKSASSLGFKAFRSPETVNVPLDHPTILRLGD